MECVPSLTTHRLLAFALVIVSDGRLAAGQPNVAEIKRQASGSFVFTDPGSHHPITVWFCRPPSLATDTRIVFIMHGSESETARQACDIAASDVSVLDAIVLAPQFSEEYYPSDAYIFGNMLDATGRILPKSQWALTAIERLFDAVRHDLALTRDDYDIVGFSGGGQFVHRLVLFVPEARFRRAVAASAGRYAFPSWAEEFPYGLADSPIDRNVLSRRSRVSSSCYSAIEISLTGTRSRHDGARDESIRRGLRFFAAATDEAAALGVPLHWQLRIVPGVDHSPVPMVRAALLELLRH